MDVKFVWNDNPEGTPWERRRLRLRNGTERVVTFAELLGMVGEDKCRRLVRLAIRNGAGYWHDENETLLTDMPRKAKAGKRKRK